MHLNVLLLSNQIRGLDGSGGLGDVPVGLAKELLARGDVEVHLAMPGYAEITAAGDPLLRDRFDPANRILAGLAVPFGAGSVAVDVYAITLPRSQPAVTCYLFRCPQVFDAPEPAGGRVDKNTPDKAILFARAALEFLRAYAGFRVDLIHCNDWHTGLVPVYLDTLYRHDHYLGRVASLYTTHNCFGSAYQGGFDAAAYGGLLRLAGLEGAAAFGAGTRSLFHDWGFNFTKGGLGFADLLNTVSRRYAVELRSPTFAGGLQGVIQERADAFTGVVNGIDITEWDPAADPLLNGLGYSAADQPQQVQAQKRKVRPRLRDWTIGAGHPRAGSRPFAGLHDHSLLIGVVSRIDFQKSPLLIGALERLCRLDGVQIAMLGCAGHNDPLGQGLRGGPPRPGRRHPRPPAVLRRLRHRTLPPPLRRQRTLPGAQRL
jgi:starch synthase